MPNSDIQFDSSGRMLFHPDYHTNHGKPLTDEELEYLCKYWEIDDTRTMSFALGRTERTLSSKVNKLRKQGRFDYYKNLNKYW